MKKEKKTGIAAVILCGAAAVLWTFRAVLEIRYETYHESVFWFIMNILCAVMWIAAFLVNLKRYRSDQ